MNTNPFTNIRFTPVRFSHGLIGFVDALYNGSIALHSIAVKAKDDGAIYLLCPSRKHDGKNIQMFHPTNSDTYSKLMDAVMPFVAKYINDSKETKQ